MNKLKYILSFLAVFTAAISCTDFVEPAIPYSDFETGVYLRTIASTSVNFNFFDLDNARFEISVEAVDEENGNLVQEVNVFVKQRRGATTTSEAKLLTIPASAFSLPSGGKYLATTISATAPQTLSALGLSKADVNGGDFFEYRLELKDTKGRVFTNSNLSGDVSGGAFYRSPFFYRVPVICPSDLAGTFDYVQNNMFCDGEITGTVTWTATATVGTYTSSDFAFGSWDHCYGAGSGASQGTLALKDACNIISVSGSDQFGDTYTYTILEVNGIDLTLKWENTYGEFGTVKLSRKDGKSWPELKN